MHLRPDILNYDYYHSDHLGSASYITDLDGQLVQHIEYIPFGEVFLEERNNHWNTPYLFNGKELDDEIRRSGFVNTYKKQLKNSEQTGLYYYGARYYDARVSQWLSVDPLAEKTLLF